MKTTKFLWFALVLMLALVFAGCEEPKDNEDPVQFKLTITGLPAATNGVWGVTLIAPSAPTVPIATGMVSPGTGAALLSVADGTGMPTAEPFNTDGTYLVGLADTSLNGQTRSDFIYMPVLPVPGTLTFNKDNKEHSIGYNTFVPAPAP